MTIGMRYGALVLVLGVAVCAGACGKGGPMAPPPDQGTADDAGASSGDDSGSLPSQQANLVSIEVKPSTAAIESVNGAVVTQAFECDGHFDDGSTRQLGQGVAWSATAPQVGAVDATGLYTASGAVGGVVAIQAAYQGQKASASLTVKLHLEQNPGQVPGAVQVQLQNASAPDPNVVWAYPYDGTVWPRGLPAPLLMWNGGAAGDDYYVHVKSATFELDEFAKATNAPASQLAIDQSTWQKLVDSTSGGTAVTVARWDGSKATLIANHAWTVAPGSMRGTIYYWANNLGRIMRLKPGTTSPTDFSAGVVPAAVNKCTMACHTVSADGSMLVAAGGTYGGSYDLVNNKTVYGLGGTADSAQIRQWGLSAVSADGQYVVLDALMNQLTGYSGAGMYKTSDGSAVANGGIPNERMYMPAFSPDGSSLVFVTGTNPSTSYWLTTGTPGTLRAMDFDPNKTPMLSNERDIVQPGSDPSNDVIAWPTVTPDGRWAVYSRLNWVDPSTQHNLSSFAPVVGDLYMADIKNPNSETRLKRLDGDNYPFAAGARDLHLNYEPSFAPVAAGGYFWVVFHSRRTYGNVLTGDRTTVKQLWVAAIDQNPQPGQDPSHPPFWLPGQDTGTLNLRGFWALDPCKGDGQGCQSGTECCGGYCAGPAGDAGGPVCQSQSQGCAQNGDRCNVTSDCCNAAAGVTCINHVCSEAPPQ
jgi:predicted small lipoprotein YifL